MNLNFVLSILVRGLGYVIAFTAFEIGETVLGVSLFFVGILIITLGFDGIVEVVK